MIEWITRHGPAHGLRIPSIAERSRALGLEPYLHTLGLTDREAYDAQGNAFDRNIVGIRCGAALQGWLNEHPPTPTHVYPTIAELHTLFRNTAIAVRDSWGDSHPELAASPFLECGEHGLPILDTAACIPPENPTTLG